MAKQGKHGIQWTDETWNVVTGCTPVSEGCTNCYAARYAKRGIGDFSGPAKEPAFYDYTGRKRPFSEVRTHPERLEKPLYWKKPRRVFVCSMGDLFHEQVPDEFVLRVFATMTRAWEHTFQVLTKRQQRIFDILSMRYMPEAMWDAAFMNNDILVDARGIEWPRPNIWLGVTCENQARADERIPFLLQTPAAVRFVSLEPCLSDIEFDPLWMGWVRFGYDHGQGKTLIAHKSQVKPFLIKKPPQLDLVIVGPETGPRRRECKLEWIESIVDQCQSAGVPVFVKALPINGHISKDMSEWPEHLRLREFPVAPLL